LGDDVENDGYQPDLKQRGGSIIPVGPVIQSTEEFRTDSLTLLVCLDKENMAAGTLYVDKGEGFDYRNGDFEADVFTAKKTGKNKVTVKCETKGKSQIKGQRYYRIGLVADSGIVYSGWQTSNTIKIKPGCRPLNGK